MQSSGPIESIAREAARLPIGERLEALKDALAKSGNAVLVAPPGAGKTSVVAPSLLGEAWLGENRILLMLPRRLAARAAAERIAGLLGEAVGIRVGYRTRLESRIGPHCRIECITEGIFNNRLIGDPELSGIGALLFDEVHERSLQGDLGLTLALDAQSAFRPDLRIVAMSATLDGARFAAVMGGAAVIESDGRAHPVTLHHIGRNPNERLEDAVAKAIAAGLANEEGSMLVFLPGVGEMERVAERLHLPEGIALHKLHGTADPAAQRAALAPGGARKCILATSIAETSLTIDGVRLVVDSGLARRPRFDRSSGLTRLVTERASQASATQRAGRAGRQAPGIAFRLWDAGETAGRIPYDPPEITEADLSPLLLDLAAWGVADPARLRWLDAPPTASVAHARGDLLALGALDADGRLTPHGQNVARLPLPPRLAHMLLAGAACGAAAMAADIAVVLSERGIGGPSADIEMRLAGFASERSARAEAARRLAGRWREAAERLTSGAGEGADAATLLAHAYPDRVARRRRAGTGSDRTVPYLMANGSGVSVDAADTLARAEWLVIADAGGAGPDARVRLAAMMTADSIADWIARHGTVEQRTAADPASGRIGSEQVQRLGVIVVARTRGERPSEAELAAALLGAVRQNGLGALPWPECETAVRARLGFARVQGLPVPDVAEQALLASLEDWLAPRLAGHDRLADVDLRNVLLEQLDHAGRKAFEAFAPKHFDTPAGTSHVIDYAADGGPEVSVRCQALFGLKAHPLLAGGRVPLTLALTSPGGRVLQKTRDLPGFWAGNWRDVQREMKGRYPRHPWPDDPAAAAAAVRTKAADARRPD